LEAAHCGAMPKPQNVGQLAASASAFPAFPAAACSHDKRAAKKKRN